jgi:aspartyl-tRNA(Asn)/glutamyl-tRNA(Gln) amidotransferase subunit A
LEKYSSFQEITAQIKKGNVSCKQLVMYYLSAIKANSHLNVFLEVYEAEALQRAEEIDRKIAAGTQGRLAGMVVGLKDVISHQNHGLQAGSRILEGFRAQFNATAVERLLAEDAIVIGRQNCDEFGMGSSNENSAFGPVLNGADPTRVPGGSSGGSAVAVQTGMCLASLGSDTGGSVRQPAAFCGLVGLKPTYSRISRWGLIAYASSFDTIGIISRSVPDAALLLEVIAGKDDFDSTVSQSPVPAYSRQLELNEKPRIAYIPETIQSAGLSEEIRQTILRNISYLKEDGYQVDAVDFPLLDFVLPAYYILTTAEASSNLARYDGVRYGYRHSPVGSLESMYKSTRSSAFGEEVKRRIMLGTFVLSADYYDAYYTKAQKVRRLIKEKTDQIFAQYDFLILPTAPTTAFRLGEHTEDPLKMYLADIYSVQANVAGIPAISIPAGKDQNSLPIGLQIMANRFEEARLLAFAHYLMQHQ